MQGTDDKTISTFFRTGLPIKYAKSELILGAEARPSGIFFIDTGYVREYTISDNGDEVVHIIYRHGEIFPFIWAYLGNNLDVYFEAMTEVLAWRVTRENFILFVKESKEIGYALAYQLAEQYNLYNDRITNLQLKTSKERVIHRLVFLASRFSTRHDNILQLDIPITHEMIAESINLARESVSREMEKLERSGFIERANHLIVIKNINILNKELITPLDLRFYGLNKDD